MVVAQTKAESAVVSETMRREPSALWKSISEPVEPFLEAVSNRLARQVTSFEKDLLPYAEYALNGNGKQLRPALVALTARAFGNPRDEHVTVAVIIEMVHLATLVHDDVMDEAEIRRGRLTLAANWGNEIAVLFGDCLFAQALKLAASFPTTDVCRAVSLATNTVCSGEILQTQHRRNFELNRSKYFKVIEMKTAELFALSCELGAFLGGASEERRQAMRQFGLAFGTAYQVYDDCLDLFGCEAAAGKSLGTDLEKGKLTLPVLVAWERAGEADRKRLQEMVQGWEPEYINPMTALLARYDALPASLRVFEEYLARAREILRVLPASGRSSLVTLTEFLQQQTDSLGVSA
ncbi:MAG TPA: polyprenyl synthetase family protein [Verrucomicrobiae bacterium]|nr:polyprenyl synthetase family protein [Verrucomicrobiae bacterium]